MGEWGLGKLFNIYVFVIKVLIENKIVWVCKSLVIVLFLKYLKGNVKFLIYRIDYSEDWILF